MGAIITFPGRRAVREAPRAMRRCASVIILPVIRVERGRDTSTAMPAPRTKPQSCRKRPGPATRT